MSRAHRRFAALFIYAVALLLLCAAFAERPLALDTHRSVASTRPAAASADHELRNDALHDGAPVARRERRRAATDRSESARRR